MDIIPKFREVDLFITTFAVLVMALLYPDIAISFVVSAISLLQWTSGHIDITENIRGCIFVIILVAAIALAILYGNYLALRSAFRRGVPDRGRAGLMVFGHLATIIPFAASGIIYGVFTFITTKNPLDIIPIAVSTWTFARSFVLITGSNDILRFADMFDYEKDTTRNEALLVCAVVIVVGVAVRLFTTYPYIIAYLFMCEAAISAVRAVAPQKT